MSRYTDIAIIYLDKDDLECYASVPCYELYIPHGTYRGGKFHWVRSDNTVIILN